jgi:hypothetical protein
MPVVGSRQLVQQRLRLFEVGCLEAFGETAIDRNEQVAGLSTAPLVAPKARARLTAARNSRRRRGSGRVGFRPTLRWRKRDLELFVPRHFRLRQQWFGWFFNQGFMPWEEEMRQIELFAEHIISGFR